jgi:hypothetical protein
MPIMPPEEPRDPASPAKIADELSYELARAFVAVACLLGDELGAPGWTPADVEAELLRRMQRRLHDFVVVFGTEDVADSLLILAEAVDNLGAGDMLDVETLAKLWQRLGS